MRHTRAEESQAVLQVDGQDRLGSVLPRRSWLHPHQPGSTSLFGTVAYPQGIGELRRSLQGRLSVLWPGGEVVTGPWRDLRFEGKSVGTARGEGESTRQPAYPTTARRSLMIELVSLPFSGISTAAARWRVGTTAKSVV